MIFLNLFIAIILQGFDDTNKRENSVLNNEAVNNFVEKWTKYDPDGKSKITVEELPNFLLDLGLPMGFSKKYKGRERQQDRFISKLNLVKYDNFTKYRFNEVLEAITLRTFIYSKVAEKNYKAEKLGNAINNEQQIISPQ